MDDLTKLAIKYGTDKCPQIKHGYTPWYYERFNHIRKKVKRFLEIGVGDERYPNPDKHYHEKSASLKMWRDFFPNAMIYGIDISLRGFYQDDRIKCFLCDSTYDRGVKDLLKKIGNTFDAIIDDGSHSWVDQIKTARVFLPRVNKDVIYLIEDVSEPKYVIKGLVGYETELIPFSKRRYDDKIIVVKNK